MYFDNTSSVYNTKDWERQVDEFIEGEQIDGQREVVNGTRMISIVKYWSGVCIKKKVAEGGSNIHLYIDYK